MDLTKNNIKKTLEKINMSGHSENIVSTGILKNIQVFGDQVDIDIVVTNPALQARKKLEVDIMKIIHDDIYEKAKARGLKEKMEVNIFIYYSKIKLNYSTSYNNIYS